MLLFRGPRLSSVTLVLVKEKLGSDVDRFLLNPASDDRFGHTGLNVVQCQQIINYRQKKFSCSPFLLIALCS